MPPHSFEEIALQSLNIRLNWLIVAARQLHSTAIAQACILACVHGSLAVAGLGIPTTPAYNVKPDNGSINLNPICKLVRGTSARGNRQLLAAKIMKV